VKLFFERALVLHPNRPIQTFHAQCKVLSGLCHFWTSHRALETNMLL